MALSFLKRKTNGERAEMSFIDHLEDLRGHLFRAVVSIAVGAIIVGINNKFTANVEFPNVATIECHVAVLDYVKGMTLKKLIESDEQIGASKIGQISIDLFTILNFLTYCATQ